MLVEIGADDIAHRDAGIESFCKNCRNYDRQIHKPVNLALNEFVAIGNEPLREGPQIITSHSGERDDNIQPTPRDAVVGEQFLEVVFHLLKIRASKAPTIPVTTSISSHFSAL